MDIKIVMASDFGCEMSDADVESYTDAVHAAVGAAYPTADVEIETDALESDVKVDGMRATDVAADVNSIVQCTWESWCAEGKA